MSQGGGCLRRPVEITAVALDRASGRLRPEQHVGAGAVVPFGREREADVGQILGLDGECERRLAIASPSTIVHRRLAESTASVSSS